MKLNLRGRLRTHRRFAAREGKQKIDPHGPSPFLPLIHDRDDGPVPAMPRRIVAAELRRIKSRGLATIQEKRIVAAKAVAEKTRKLIEAHPVLGDNEMDVGGACDADTISWLSVT